MQCIWWSRLSQALARCVSVYNMTLRLCWALQTSAASQPRPGRADRDSAPHRRPRPGPPVRHYELEFSGALTGDLATWQLCDAALQILIVDSRLLWLVFSERVEDAGYNNSAGVYPGNPGGLHLTHNLHLCQQNPSVQGDRQQDRRGRSQ